MRQTRDRWIAAGALGVLVVLAVAVVLFVLDAQRAGIETREDLRRDQVKQLANSMETRIQQAYGQLAGIYGAPGHFRMVPGDPQDREKLAPLVPTADTGSLLVDRNGVIVNAVLLRDPSSLGKKLVRGGLERALEGEAVILDIEPGLTTTDKVISLALPLHAADGTLSGALVYESPASPASAFNQEVAALKAGRTGKFSYLDQRGTVAASSDETSIGQRFPLPAEATKPGFHRIDSKVTAAADVPAAGWRLVFVQSKSEFEGDVTRPVRNAIVLLLLVATIAGTVSVVSLLRRLRAAREEQRRLAEVSAAQEEFTSIVSHELRTPVAGLLGFLQTTLDHWEEMTVDERRRAVERAEQNAVRLQQLTTEVLDATAMDTVGPRLIPTTVDLRDVIGDSVETTRDANPGRTIELRAPADEVIVDADPARIRQVVTNLLDNAVKSSPPDSPVHVIVDVDGTNTTVSVRDFGSGIAFEDRERIFDKYMRGRIGATRGTGLGLYVAREIVDASGGKIWVDDPDGPGAAIAFSLPIAGDGGGK
jgi:signal transduction histidine kinase